MSPKTARALLVSLFVLIVPALVAARNAKPAPPAGAGAAAAKVAPAANAKGGDANDVVGGMSAFSGLSITSKKEPIEITSEKLDFDYKSRHTVFRGDVQVVQGDVHLQSDALTVDYDQVGDKQELREVTADGHVVITQGQKKASGDHAVFDQSKRIVVLTGNAVLEQGTNQVNGDKIVVHPDDSKMEVIGENRRVKVVLFPGGQGTPGAASGTPAPAGTPRPAASPPAANRDANADGAG
jgi:lipopolysaccharide export system protein LptA